MLKTPSDIQIPLAENRFLTLTSLNSVLSENETWHQITYEDFVSKILPVWEDITIHQPKHLILYPYFFAFRVSPENIIFFSIFDENNKYPETDLAGINIFSYLDEIPYGTDSNSEDGSEYIDERDLSPVYYPLIGLPIPDYLQVSGMRDSFPTDEIEDAYYFTVDGKRVHLGKNPPKDDTRELIEVHLLMSPTDLLDWYMNRFEETEPFLIREHFVYIIIGEIPKLKEMYGDAFFTLGTDLNKHPKEEVKKFIYTTLRFRKLVFE